MSVDAELLSLFFEETNEHIEKINECLLELETNPANMDYINQLFRSIHTIKGSTAAMNFSATSRLIHRLEDLIQAVRDKKLVINAGIMKLLFHSHDFLEKFLKAAKAGISEDCLSCTFIFSQLNSILQSLEGGNPALLSEAYAWNGLTITQELLSKLQKGRKEGKQPITLHIKIIDQCIFKSISLWMCFEEVEKSAEILASAPVKPTEEEFKSGADQLDSGIVDLLLLSSKNAGELVNELKAIITDADIIDAEELDELDEVNYDRLLIPSLDQIGQSIGESCICHNVNEIDVTKSICRQNLNTSPVIRKSNSDEETVNISSITTLQHHPNTKNLSNTVKDASNHKETLHINYLRIPENKVDSLSDLLGELIIMQSQQKEDISTAIYTQDYNRLYSNISRIERITRDLQSITMTLRMVSIKQTFQKILRIGRDTARELGRNVSFTVLGEETEVDRSVIEKLHDPLMHLIRNAVSHGIEASTQDRIRLGKEANGNIRIAAWSRKGTIYIEITDDGKGIDLEGVYNKALDLGLLQKDKDYTEHEIINFIFHPGFSTQESINNISGRGVGMNVVEEEIKKAGGRVEVKTTSMKGTTVLLKIPINHATINGIIVDIQGQRYVLPTMSIMKIFKPEEPDWVSIQGSVRMVKNRGELVKLVDIYQLLNFSENYLDKIIIVLEHDGDTVALPVNEVLGKQEIVIKPLDETFCHLGFISGSTIMGDGNVAFILDVESFFKVNS